MRSWGCLAFVARRSVGCADCGLQAVATKVLRAQVRRRKKGRNGAEKLRPTSFVWSRREPGAPTFCCLKCRCLRQESGSRQGLIMWQHGRLVACLSLLRPPPHAGCSANSANGGPGRDRQGHSAVEIAPKNPKLATPPLSWFRFASSRVSMLQHFMTRNIFFYSFS